MINSIQINSKTRQRHGKRTGCLFRLLRIVKKLELDTDHSFYLLDGQIVDDGAAALLQERPVGEQRRHRHFGRHSDVAQWRRRVRRRPLRYVQQPFGTVAVFEQVAHLLHPERNQTIISFLFHFIY